VDELTEGVSLGLPQEKNEGSRHAALGRYFCPAFGYYF
jgi:hypothetical protein